ncbi:hypothetical protein AYO47_08770 [Planctomyces sp. SCGC AG-212-M04]|nr:hypothetical protein AYO47_08770 [Planctomyces sp. SCGC AG-212-M04]
MASVLVLAIGEVAVRIGVACFRPKLSLEAILKRQREAGFPTIPTRSGVRAEIVHPYVGFVVDPNLAAGFNQYGFLQVDGPILKRRPGLTIVGITGGSVARDLCQKSSGALKQRLRELIGAAEIAVVCLAQEGFHQPQQVMAWSLFRSLGAEFDYLVNLDGFNDVVLYQKETGDDFTWFAYPRAWETRLSDTANPELNRLIGLGVILRQRRMQWAARFHRLERIPLLSIHMAWNAIDEHYTGAIADVTGQMQTAKLASLKSYSHTGPAVQFSSNEARIAALVELWANSSENLSQMCSGAGTTYVHCLQPNIGFNRKKSLTEFEQELTTKDRGYQPAAAVGYPELLAKNAELRSKGIHFEDLTALYADVAEGVYSDDCCHMTELGYELLATAVADALGKVDAERR